MTPTAPRRWRTSSRSGSSNNNNCVQATTASPGIAVRDSKNPHGPMLAFTSSAWHDFTWAIKASTPQPRQL